MPAAPHELPGECDSVPRYRHAMPGCGNPMSGNRDPVSGCGNHLPGAQHGLPSRDQPERHSRNLPGPNLTAGADLSDSHGALSGSNKQPAADGSRPDSWARRSGVN